MGGGAPPTFVLVARAVLLLNDQHLKVRAASGYGIKRIC
jgi:hypothetical protein